MPVKRIILEMGTGNDLYGEDYTKAAKRAVRSLQVRHRAGSGVLHEYLCPDCGGYHVGHSGGT